MCLLLSPPPRPSTPPASLSKPVPKPQPSDEVACVTVKSHAEQSMPRGKRDDMEVEWAGSVIYLPHNAGGDRDISRETCFSRMPSTGPSRRLCSVQCTAMSQKNKTRLYDCRAVFTAAEKHTLFCMIATPAARTHGNPSAAPTQEHSAQHPPQLPPVVLGCDLGVPPPKHVCTPEQQDRNVMVISAVPPRWNATERNRRTRGRGRTAGRAGGWVGGCVCLCVCVRVRVCVCKCVCKCV